MAGCGDTQHTHPGGHAHSHEAEEPGGRTVKCVKFQKDLPGLEKPPLPGELGQRIFENVSREGWKLWTEHSKMLINEYRLSLIDPKARVFLREQAEQFFFGEGSALPPDYVPQKAKS
jgi:Fe-S cluster biosynthesis and repair protein YggX